MAVEGVNRQGKPSNHVRLKRDLFVSVTCLNVLTYEVRIVSE